MSAKKAHGRVSGDLRIPVKQYQNQTGLTVPAALRLPPTLALRRSQPVRVDPLVSAGVVKTHSL